MTFWGKFAAEPLVGFSTAGDGNGDGAVAGEVAPEAPATPQQAASASADTTLPDPTLMAGLLTLGLFAVAVAIAIVLNWRKLTAEEFNPASNTAANFALFAGFYVGAQV